MNGTAAQAVVDGIRSSHQVMTPVNVIARTLHLSEHIVRHAIEFGRLPESQPQWLPPNGQIEA